MAGYIGIDLQASQPVISGITFTNNLVNGVSVEGGSLPAGTITWNNPSVVYWLNSNVTVPAGSTLVIDPGQVVKFGDFGATTLTVQGTLQAQGTAAQPIVFTSMFDDSAGGDTDNDGSKTSPNPNRLDRHPVPVHTSTASACWTTWWSTMAATTGTARSRPTAPRRPSRTAQLPIRAPPACN